MGHFDLDGAKWSVPFTELEPRTECKKNDKRVDEPFEVPLSRQAVALMRELHKITGHSRARVVRWNENADRNQDRCASDHRIRAVAATALQT